MRAVLILAISFFGMTSSAFTLLQAGLRGWDNRPLLISYNPANCPSDINELMEKAAAIWSSVLDSGLRIKVSPDSTCSPSTIWSGNCSDAFALACDTNFTSTVGVSAMGVATVRTDSSHKIIRGMGLYNVQGGGGLIAASDHFRLVVVTHEMGHALGLGHSADTEAIMASGGDTGGHARLSPDDQQGVRYLYPGNELSQKELLGCGMIAMSHFPKPPTSPWSGLLVLLPVFMGLYLRLNSFLLSSGKLQS